MVVVCNVVFVVLLVFYSAIEMGYDSISLVLLCTDKFYVVCYLLLLKLFY